jgi:hypothetical protein
MLDKAFVRRKSTSVVSAAGVLVPSSLPALEEMALVRTEREIVSRLLALSGLMAAAVGFSKEKALQWIEDQGVGSSLTPLEQEFLRDSQGEPAQFHVLVEAMWALAWAVQIVDVMDVLSPCSDAFVFEMPNLKEHESSGPWFERARLRPLEEIVQMLDIMYCLHWAVREASLGGTPLRRNLLPYVVVERRRALEWITHHELWDAIELDT